MKEKGFILWEACTAEDHRPQSERMLRVPMPLYPSSLFSIYYQVTSMETSSCQAKQARKRKERVWGTWFTRAFSASSSFPFYYHAHP